MAIWHCYRLLLSLLSYVFLLRLSPVKAHNSLCSSEKSNSMPKFWNKRLSLSICTRPSQYLFSLLSHVAHCGPGFSAKADKLGVTKSHSKLDKVRSH